MTNEEIFTTILVSATIAFIIFSAVWRAYRHVFVIAETFAGVLYQRGRHIETLVPGEHVRWGRKFRLVPLDTRQTLLQVPGQEVLTADHVSVKVSLVLSTQIIDAARSLHGSSNSTQHLYSAAQTALRTAVAGFTLEALLAQRVPIGAQVREQLAPAAEAVGMRLHGVEVRDVMLPGELRKAFYEALQARQEGQAALERARAESASLRHLANAARLLDGHPALATLRFLQSLETSAAHRTLVMNDLSAFLAPLTASRAKTAPAAESPET
jgi:regulator of protease activity HflC (stomatin/prohibitin superfamily)